MNNLIAIRGYNPNDKNDLLNLFELNSPKYFAVEEKLDFDHYLDKEIESYFVLEYDEQIVGCGGINFSDNNTIAVISWDIIHPEYQGKSLGTRLLKYRLDKLNLIQTVQKVIVRTAQHTYPFYEKQGFELIEIIEDYWAKGFDLYNMQLRK